MKLKTDGKWDGKICIHIKKFFNKVAKFFQWYKENTPKKRQIISEYLRKFDELDRLLPPSIEDRIIKNWQDLDYYFQGISHHSKKVDVGEFEQYQFGLEQFLIEKLSYRIYKSISVIDKIIGEGDSVE